MGAQTKADLGLIGLAVMGQNLVLNMADHGFTVAVFNRTVRKVDDFLAGPAKGTSVIGVHSIPELAAALERPRRVMFLVKAGQAVDDMIDLVLPHLEKGDIIIDGGNSHYTDTIRRCRYVESKGLLFVGTGVSGGEEGARRGPSLMPGGSQAAWEYVRPIFQAVAARSHGEPCCSWVGADGAGHYVKMVHNGIEYGDMQLICEAYHLMKEGLGMSPEEMHQTFARWNQGRLDSYLIEITRDILATRAADGTPILDKILDAAGQKGTGRWASEDALDRGIPLTMVTEAVLARSLSDLKDERVNAAKLLTGPKIGFAGDRRAFLDDLEGAVYAAKLISYTQGYMLMRAAAIEHHWDLKNGEIALMWRGGCIIRSAFLGKIEEAYRREPGLANLLFDPFFKHEIEGTQSAWRRVVAKAVELGIPVPAMSSALAFYDGYRRERLPANLLQAQRDYFGAHTYERVDQPRGQFFHTDWTGHGGKITASEYKV